MEISQDLVRAIAAAIEAAAPASLEDIACALQAAAEERRRLADELQTLAYELHNRANALA
jgi:hypothetical protein